MTKFDSNDLRQALGTFATGVTVITACSADDELAGVTANSFTSVSLDPPLILWCLASNSDSLRIFQDAEYFAVNILASYQKPLSNHFAKRQADKFRDMDFRRGLGQAPILSECLTVLECRSRQMYESGDHWILIGEIENYETSHMEALLFHLGSYAISLPLPTDESGVINTINTPEDGDDSLFSLLFQAIHAYQEKFELRQNEIIESNYEARVITLLRKYTELEIEEVCQMIQTPRTDTQAILENLSKKGFVWIDSNPVNVKAGLSRDGKIKSEELHHMAIEHDLEISKLFESCNAEAFRDSLKQIIKWGETE